MFFWYFRFNTSISFSAWAVPRSFNSCNPWHKPTLDMIAHVIVNRTELGPTEIKILSICQTCFFPEKTNESQNRDANSIVRIQIDIMTSIPNIHNKLCHPCAKIKDQICSKEILGPCRITSRCSAMMLEFFWASLFQVCNSSWSSSSSWTVTRMHQYDWKGVLLSTKCVKSVSFIFILLAGNSLMTLPVASALKSFVVSGSAPTIDVTPKSCSSGTFASVLPTHLRPG